MKYRARYFSHPILWISLTVLPLAGDPLRGADFIRGDANGDGLVTLSDVHRILLFTEFGREAPECLNACDVNDDGEVERSPRSSVETTRDGARHHVGNLRVFQQPHNPSE